MSVTYVTVASDCGLVTMITGAAVSAGSLTLTAAVAEPTFPAGSVAVATKWIAPGEVGV